MTGARELVQVRVVPAAPEHVRLSVVGGRTQLDVSLPLDAPIASLMPELVKLVESRDVADRSEDTSAKEAKRNFWVLSRADDAEPLSPDATLRSAGVENGALLRLTAERALSAPTLYDDVVDAAARLNRASYAGWDAVAAKWMAFTGVLLTSLALLYFLVADAFEAHRPALVGVSIVAALTLVGVGALAHRSYREPAGGAVLGWAAIPIASGVVWALSSGWGGYALAAGCAGLIVILLGFYRAIGTGHWGYLAGGVFFGLAGLALLVHQVGVRTDFVGSGLAVVGILTCLTVPRMTAPLERFKAPTAADEPDREDTLFQNPFDTPPRAIRADGEEAADSTPTAEGVWDRVRSAMLTRSALYTGLAAAAAVGAAVVLSSEERVHWSGLTFAVICTVALSLYTRRPGTPVERASLAVPALALAVYTGWAAQNGSQPIPLVAFGLLLVAAVVCAVVAMVRTTDDRFATVLAYLEYLASAALIPLALWVTGIYSRLEI
ncbi:secretion system protein ESX-1 [Mycolicibacterium mageritense DSM 44476 = CIP 104973]|uniref:Type VII secretion integral membrane protein EccD n=1 Tax=Mycolicibacterium mageritense TaxID=53462 RepID=A0ABN5Y4N5_MYCME|nr:type VII secretion integral membrane protein EccD [Mycolicibacterium mageritense]MCC9184066.1 type VII secretion integral membrane protein EccD [Mycolicibacterium mageritense]BBX33130.1 type VII secretion integral membrane protein EccD [Mycolicibacterium mageritense]CDO21564.1 type VII secretion integral membrane protein EccD [Mycolicibacterium mageritense DSM 44476 = CIP 104973]